MTEVVSMPDHDVIIAGGGPVGSALALALADGRRRIVVIEAHAGHPAAAAGSGARATVLADGSVRLLDALGVWPALAPEAVPVHRVEVSQRGHFGRTRITAAEQGVAALGQVVAHGALAHHLASAAQAAPGVTWLAPTRVTGAHADPGGIAVDLATDAGAATRGARLAVAADGTASPLRTALGIATSEHDYHQVALLIAVEGGGDPHTAHERFTDDGTLALLPGGGARRMLVWSVPAERAQGLAALPASGLAGAIQHRLGSALAPVRVVGGVQQYPLKRVEARRLVAGRAAIVGNAARTLHPVAAQGFNLALRDACGLAARLLDAEDPGDAGVLADWYRQRRLDQWLTRGFTDVLARGFGHGLPGLAGPRAGVLVGLDLCGAGRDGLAARTMGLAGGLPRVGRWRPEALT